MKNYLPGIVISLICLIILFIINSQIYSNIMSLKVLILLLPLQVIFFKYLLTQKKWIEYLIFVCIFVIALYISLPDLTQKQATEKVIEMHDIDITEATTVPTNARFGWNPFVADGAYFFRGFKKDEIISIIVNDDGDVLIVEK